MISHKQSKTFNNININEMKKVIFASLMFALLFGAVDTFAQGLGVKGSFNMFNLSEEDLLGDKVKNKMIPTFDAGVFLEIPLVPEFYIRPELLFAQKGGEYEGVHETKARINYLELPVLFLYKGGLGDSHVLLGFGPYVSYGLMGKVKSDAAELDVKFKSDVKLTDVLSALYVKPFDFGATIMAGYEFSGGLSFALNASLGLSDIEPKVAGKELDSSIKNVGFGLSLGYRFGK